MNKKNRQLRIYTILSILISVLLVLILQTPFFGKINNLFLDPLQSETKARKEVVIVGIDDKSLQLIGAWPWDRSIFAKAFNNLSNDQPKAIGVDVLFLETRENDKDVFQSIENSTSPIIFGSKLVDGEVLKSIYINSDNLNAKSGFVNFSPDSDGKIRNSQLWSRINNKCEVSLALSLASEYFSLNQDNLCNNPLVLRNATYNLDFQQSLRFSYTKDNFQYIPFINLLNNKFDEGFFKDKIILIGSTALDLRSGLNDNFVDIFGDTIPGVEIHANMVNSFLQERFYFEVSELAKMVLYLILGISLLISFYKIKSSKTVAILFISVEIINFFASLVLIQYGILNTFIQFAIFILGIYIFVLLYRYITQDKENRYIKSVFSRYLNQKLLNILLQNADKLQLGGETREMAVMFSDIRGFTTISEGLQPSELVQMVNDYLGYMSTIILNNNGTIDKYIGDAIMAFWNAPLDDANYDSNAIKTALEMQQQLKEFGELYPQYPTIKIGIGINSGLMTVGNVGGKERFDYTVLGDNVNLASRLEGLTKKYGVIIIVSESTMKGSQNSSIIFRLLDDMMVKGKKESVKIYEPMLESNENEVVKSNYEKGFELYQKANWVEAIKLLQKNINDSASELLIIRIQELKQNPLENWDGIWKWLEK